MEKKQGYGGCNECGNSKNKSSIAGRTSQITKTRSQKGISLKKKLLDLFSKLLIDYLSNNYTKYLLTGSINLWGIGKRGFQEKSMRLEMIWFLH